MTGRGWFRLGMKALHEISSIAFGGALLACLVINVTAERGAGAAFDAARHLYAAIANYVLIPSMAVVVVSGLLALAATRGYLNAGWAWVKALLGLSVFQATLVVVAAGSRQGEIAAAAGAGDAALLDSLLRSERHTLILLIVLSLANVVLAVWRPKFSKKRD